MLCKKLQTLQGTYSQELEASDVWQRRAYGRLAE